MSHPQSNLDDLARQLPLSGDAITDGFAAKEFLDDAEKKIDEIELIGEEEAAGFHKPGVSQISPGMRYLHASRTIHQLTGDRNRALGIFLAVAGLLWTASAAVMNARENVPNTYIIPLDRIQRWCMPMTFGVMSVLSVFIAFLMIRTRVGLIYEVAKMNVLLGLPIGRVKRVNPLSIFFIMQAMVSVAGGLSAGLLAAHLLWDTVSHPAIYATLIGTIVCIALMALYVGTVKHTTSDEKLQSGG